MELKKQGSDSTMLFLFLIIPFFKPAEYVFGLGFDTFLDIWKIFSSLTALYIYIKRSVLSNIVLFTILFQSALTIPTLLKGGSELKNQIVFMLSNTAFAIIVEVGIRYYKDSFLKAITVYGEIICFITAVTMFIYYPDGMDQKEFMDLLGDKNYYFLGHDNGSFFIVFAVQIFSLINCINKKGFISAGHILLWLFIDGAFIYVRSGAAMAAIVMLWFYLIFLYNKDISEFVNIKTYMTAIVILFFSIVIFRLHVYFLFIIENVFHKDITLSGRTILWDIAITHIKASPLIGYGREATAVMMQKFRINHVHNIILEIMYQSGIIGMAVYSAIVFLIVKSLTQCRGNKINDLTAFAVFLYYLISMVDYYNSKYLIYGIIVLAYNMPYLTEKAMPEPKREEARLNDKDLSLP